MATYFGNIPVIGCDTGNKNVKTAHTITLAGIRKLPSAPAIAPADPMDVLLIDGAYYVVDSERLPYERNKVLSESHLLLTLIAVAKEMRALGLPPTSKVALAVGLPPGHMSNATLVNQYRSYFLKNGGVHRFQCGGISYQITFTDVVVCPQAYSVVCGLPSNVTNSADLYLIDIGGGTVDSIHLIRKNADPRIISLDLGVIFLYSEIQSQLQNSSGLRISEEQIDDILLDRPGGVYKPELKKMVLDIAEAHAKKIFDEFRDNAQDWRLSYVVFCGGGAVLLKKYIEKYAPAYTGDFTVLDDISANAKGFEVMGKFSLNAKAK